MTLFLPVCSLGICIIVYAGLQKEKYDIDGYNKNNDSCKTKKRAENFIGMWCGCIMLAATAIFLIAGIGYNMWSRSWLVFPVGGILCGIVTLIIAGITKDE